MKELIISIILFICNTALADLDNLYNKHKDTLEFNEFLEKRLNYCNRIYERMYIPLAYQCERLNLEPFYEIQCYNDIIKTIDKMIVYCNKQESFDDYIKRFF